jgi:WXG100 family type VII secretion target
VSSPADAVASELLGLAGRLRDALARAESIGGELLAGRPAELREAAGAWRQTARVLSALEEELEARSRRTLSGAWEGAASQAYSAEWRELGGKFTEVAAECGRMAAALEERAGRAGVVNAEARLVMDAMRGLARAAEGAAVNPAGAMALAGQVTQVLGRWEELARQVEAETAALMALLMALRLLVGHQVGELSRVHPVWLPGYPPRLGLRYDPGAIALPRRPGGGPPTGKNAALGALAALLAMLAAAAGPNFARTLEEYRREQKRKAVSQALVAAPRPPLRPEDEDQIQRSARELQVDRARFEQLARDPAEGGKVDEGSIEEARIAIRLERSGQLSDVVRSPQPETDFLEDGGAGQGWDVKSFRSSRFSLDQTLQSVDGELGQGHNVIINTAHLDSTQVAEVQQAIQMRGWSGRVIFASSE